MAIKSSDTDDLSLNLVTRISPAPPAITLAIMAGTI